MASSSTTERKVLIAVDGSTISEHAFQWYLEFVYRPGDFLIICHIPQLADLPAFTFKRYLDNLYHARDTVIVCHIPESPKLHSFHFRSGLSVPTAEWKDTLEKEIAKVQKLHNHYQMELEQRKIPCILVGENNNNKGAAIMKAAQEQHADCIVIGTRSLDAVRRTFQGSVSDFVTHNSSIPVIVVPDRSK